MKKFICMLLVVVMMLSLIACGGKTEPVATTPPVDTTVTEPVGEEAPQTPSVDASEPEVTEPIVERIPPTDFEAVDPATLPAPTPVEEQLLSEDTQTVTFDTIEEYEDFLWSLGFEEVRLVGTHKTMVGTSAYCEPVSLTYNSQAFRLEFVYCITNFVGEVTKENDWIMYGTKSNIRANVTPLNENEYGKTINTNSMMGNVIVLEEGQTIDSIDISQIVTNNENAEHVLATTETPNMETETMSFIPYDKRPLDITTKAVYYPITGNLYNYYQSIEGDGFAGLASTTGAVSVFGIYAETMCFHYIFPEE